MKLVIAYSAALLLQLAFAGQSHSAEYYRWVDESGVLHITDNLHNVPPNQRPRAGLYFLDITEEMLKGEPQIEEVLPRFRSFIGDSILVAHNGAFDLNFIQSVAEKSGVRFNNPLLDTLLLSMVVDEDETDYTLANIGERLGVDAVGGHTIMDDCFGTAQIFLKLLQLLEDRGITTLAGAMAACERVAAAKRQ